MNKLAKIATVVFVSTFISACSQESAPDADMETSEVKVSEHAVADAKALADAAKAKAAEMKDVTEEKVEVAVEKAKEMAQAAEVEVKEAVEATKTMVKETSEETGLTDKIEDAKGMIDSLGE